VTAVFSLLSIIDETAIDLWRVNGLKPPPPSRKLKKQWGKDNTPSPDERTDAG
jgi:Putative oxalocrotonate tautomerase enzyme